MGTRRASGFTLVEIVVVMVILAVLIAMAAALTRGVTAAQKRSLTSTRLAGVDAALAQFVSQQRRLPCPANGTLVSSDAGAGAETARTDAAGCTTNQQDGVVPWRALGLSEVDATDGWDRRLTYRLDPALARINGMNMSWCDPAGTETSPPAPAAPRACNTACTNTTLSSCTRPSDFLSTRGLEIRNKAGTTLMNPAGTPHTGAAYVVISAGESGGGAYLNSGQLGVSTVGDGTEEQKNYASLPYAGVATYYVDDSLSEVNDATHFDDMVSRPPLLGVITKAGLGPRSR